MPNITLADTLEILPQYLVRRIVRFSGLKKFSQTSIHY